MRRFPPQPRLRAASWLRFLLMGLASLLSALLLAPSFLTELPASAQQAGYGQTLGSSPAERQFYDYGPNNSSTGSGGSSLLNTTNPMDLMNKLRRSTALDDATSPSSAIDQALKDLEASSAASAPRATSPMLQAP
ncbi:MAG: hypothetical protein VKI42_02030 [Synechococcaceae cyanobacterium]|nr:hypothetical protein [Synechococcaceae cyanobacterium]